MKTKTTSKSPENQNNKCVAFYRVSTDRQETDRQFDDVRKYCAAYGYEIVKEFEETVSGAAELNDRKELQAMMNYVENNKVQYCVVSELSRVGRSNLTLTIIERLTKLGICFISLKEGLKTLNSDGTLNPTTQLIIDILNGINKFDLSTITYRVKSGLRKTANAGTWIGGQAPYGYDIVDKKLVINSEADTVKFIFDKYAEGWSSYKIVSHLNINKIPTKGGSTWMDQKVYKILKNSIYVGKRNWNDDVLNIPELRLIEDSIFTAVQDRLNKKSNIKEVNKHYKYEYPLKEKIICACGKHFIGVSRADKYMCRSKKYGKGCNTKSIKMDWIHTEIMNNIKDHAKLLWDYSGITNQRKEYQDEIINLQKQIDDEKLTQNYYINNISKIGQQVFDTKFDKSTELVKQLQKKIDELNIKLSHTKVFEGGDEIRNGKLIGKEILRRMDVNIEIIRKVIERIDVDNEKVVVNLINEKSFTIDRIK